MWMLKNALFVWYYDKNTFNSKFHYRRREAVRDCVHVSATDRLVGKYPHVEYQQKSKMLLQLNLQLQQ